MKLVVRTTFNIYVLMTKGEEGEHKSLYAPGILLLYPESWDVLQFSAHFWAM